MRHNVPRLASYGVLAALLIPLLPAQVVSQPGCPSRVASSDGVNPKYPSCAVLLQGSYKNTWSSGSDFEVIVVLRRTAILAMRFDDRQLHAADFHLAIALAGVEEG